jgi:iron(III) transport system permease protein
MMRTAVAAARTGWRPGRRPPFVLWALALCSVALVLLPLVYLVIRAGGGDASAWSVLGRRGTAETILKTVALVVGVTASSVAIGVPLAWLVTRTDLPGRKVWAVAAALPLVIPSYVAALALLGAFGPRGLLQQALEGPLGVERVPDIYGYPGALLALTLSTYPYVFLLAMAGFRGIDPSLEEASAGLGRSRPATFFRVTLPVARPSIAAGALLVALYTLADFGAVSLMQYDSLTRAIFLQYRALFDRTPAAVLALVLVALTAIVLMLEAAARSRRRAAGGRPASGRVARPVELGRWRMPAVGLCILVTGAFLAVPLAVLGYWLARAVSTGQDLSLAWAPLGNTVLAAFAAAGAATLAALPVALLARRYPSRATATVERLAYVSNALPGIVIALSLVFFAARYASPIYQTLGLLIVAYVVRFLPEALAGTGSALAAVSPRVEEAAAGLGRSRLRVLVEVTIPLARAGILAGAALVVLSTMKELPATLLLRPIGFETLATEIWRFTSIGAYSRAALPALLLVAAAAPAVYFLVRRGAREAHRP